MASTPPLQFVVLAAGIGSRLGRPGPKCLTPLANGQTILERQLSQAREVFNDNLRTCVVVGFKLELVLEAFPDVLYIYNERYDRTNTSKSLLKGLRLSGEGGVLWVNGDVVIDTEVLHSANDMIAAHQSFICVRRGSVGAEEVKYTVGADDLVLSLSKSVDAPVGEAIGVNYVAPADKLILIRHLEACGDDDYFEAAVERAIVSNELRFRALDVTAMWAVEIDFDEDLRRVDAELMRRARPRGSHPNLDQTNTRP